MTGGEQEHLSREQLLAALVDDNSDARTRFREALGDSLEEVFASCRRAYRAVDSLNNGHPGGDGRFDHVRLFMHAAFNNVLSSTNLLVAGYPLASGHLMRHAAESLALALLIADPLSGVFERFQREQQRFPAHDAIGKLRSPKQWRRVAGILDLADEGATMLHDLQDFYSEFSHSGAFAMGYHFIFAIPGSLTVGAEFDPDKVDQARIELATRAKVFHAIEDLAWRIGEVLSPSAPSPSP